MVSSLLSVCDGANLSIREHAYNLYHVRRVPYKFVVCVYMTLHELSDDASSYTVTCTLRPVFWDMTLC